MVADLFGDVDLRHVADDSMVVAGSIEHGFDDAGLLSAADRLAPPGMPPYFGLVCGAGLEGRPELLAKLTRGRRLYGNAPGTVARIKDPADFFDCLDRLGVPHPPIALAQPDNAEGWLAKRAGGCGGGHVVPATDATPSAAGQYFQRHMPGKVVGLSFLADGRRAFPLGVSEQWPAPAGAGQPFRFGGAAQPAMIRDTVSSGLRMAVDALVREYELVGLNSLDAIVDGDSFTVIELNPRPGANVDVFDGASPSGLFARHVAACDGRLPQRAVAPPAATAMAVVYADRARKVPTDVVWPDWMADRPAPGSCIQQDAPVCTVLVEAAHAAAARQRAVDCTAQALALLPPDDAGMSRQLAGGLHG